jgi:hypothetical protein
MYDRVDSASGFCDCGWILNVADPDGIWMEWNKARVVLWSNQSADAYSDCGEDAANSPP